MMAYSLLNSSDRMGLSQNRGEASSGTRPLVVLVLVSTLVLGGCGGGSEQPSDPSGVLSGEQIADALLQQGSTVAGGVVGPEDLPGLADDREADPITCQPLAAIVDLETAPVRSDRIQAKRPRLGAWVHVQLLTYAADDAARTFDLVDEAVGSCSKGYTEDRVRDAIITSVVRSPAPELGDDATAYQTSYRDADDSAPIEVVESVVLIRDGQQLLSFRATSLEGPADAQEMLGAVIEAQWLQYSNER